MDWKVSWTPEAVADLGGIVRHIARDDSDAAWRMGEDLLACAASLRSFPRRGRRYDPALDRGEVRELPSRGYRVFYRVSESRSLVEVVKLWHGARDEPDLG